MGIALKDVDLCGEFEVVHYEGASSRTDEASDLGLKVDGEEAVQLEGGKLKLI